MSNIATVNLKNLKRITINKKKKKLEVLAANKNNLIQ